ncbi:hypothetical protein F4559_002816 [Saccharothrix violaceirubra]|uniref:Uncharacterized protein n=1 Tax=Saccharothrix violaceirubra TaxID=413306 RepID=A0A7W7T3N7_9PSEU|nr:hypothetical protein [Saccharothrix violaceirubra]
MKLLCAWDVRAIRHGDVGVSMRIGLPGVTTAVCELDHMSIQLK